MMARIAHKERNFSGYLENHFGIRLPEGIGIFYAKGVRVGGRDMMKSDIRGEKGYAACDAGFNPTNALIQNFGHLATKNFVDVSESQAREFALGRGLGNIDLGKKSGFVAVRWGRFTVGLGYYESAEKKIRNRIPEKRQRKIMNSLRLPAAP